MAIPKSDSFIPKFEESTNVGMELGIEHSCIKVFFRFELIGLNETRKLSMMWQIAGRVAGGLEW